MGYELSLGLFGKVSFKTILFRLLFMYLTQSLRGLTELTSPVFGYLQSVISYVPV